MAERIINREHLLRTDSIGFHGTSLEATLFMLQHGYLPGSTVQAGDPLFHQSAGQFFFFGRKDTYPISVATLRDSESAFQGATAYAREIAARHFLIGKMGLDLTNPHHLRLVGDVSDGPYRTQLIDHKKLMQVFREKGLLDLVEVHTTAFEKHIKDTFMQLQNMGFSLPQLTQMTREAKKREGVVIALTASIVDSFSIEPDEADGALVVNTEHGLPIDFVSGIYPIGKIEQAGLTMARL